MANRSDTRPVMAAIMGHFSTLAEMNEWQNLEQIFNPGDFFKEVHIVALGDAHKYKKRHFGTVHVHPIRSIVARPSLKLINNIYLMFAGFRRLLKIAGVGNIDLFAQIDATPLKYGLPAILAASRKGLPCTITLCNDYRAMASSYSPPLRWVNNFLWGYIFRNCARIRSKSEYMAEFAYAHGVSPERLDVIPNKFPLSKFQYLPNNQELADFAQRLGIADLLSESIVCLTVARLIEVKNLDRQLRAFAKACQRQRNLVYLILGVGPLQSRLEVLIDELGISKNVRLLGYLPHDQLRYIYHLSDILLFATLYEGQPRVVIEAMLSNLPVICANYGEVCNIVADRQDGLWVDPLDVHAIEEAIVQLASDRTMRAKMSRHSEYDAERFSAERVNAQEAEFYLAVISGAQVSGHVTR